MSERIGNSEELPRTIPEWLKDEINKLLNGGSLSHKECMILEWILSLEDDS